MKENKRSELKFMEYSGLNLILQIIVFLVLETKGEFTYKQTFLKM